MEENKEKPVDGILLLRTIAEKKEDLDAAKKAFDLFASYFEDKIKVLVEIHAAKIGYDENVAFEAIICAFNKVWLYPTFNMRKAHCKNVEHAIIIWLVRIAVSQMHQFSRKGVCAQIKEEDDLSVIEDSLSFVNSFKVQDLDPETKMNYVIALNEKLSILDEKHRIIYLTYKTYHVQGKKLPRIVLEKLRKRLGLVQATVRVYKKEACEALNDFTILEA